ncbi:hypothetical protein [Saccharothrix texasensis]|uniref:Uncharacterized protein n=1 Tax=Saccharothrix texasensis TaxID=103734 RepID=A0A3N1H3H9_9PSEU|nr:hypothetical protein [Saccharothrix texasensis]ROP37073.1 hypothetical protein EDD40_2359 [Saccharothrix texasensis]
MPGSARSWKRFAAIGAVAAVALTGVTTPAGAATSTTFGPVTITGVPPLGKKIHLVREMGRIEASMTAGQTAYVYSTLRAYDSGHVNLVDNEVRCAGAGGSNVVVGENIDPAGTANPGRGDITLVNRFLVSATTTGTLSCTLYLRTHSLAEATSSFTVSGTLRFASLQVAEDVNGTAMQTSLPNGNIVVGSDDVYTPVLDRRIGTGHSQVAVIADVEYMSCLPAVCKYSYTTSSARFTLFAHQMNGDAFCSSAEIAQTSVTVNRQTHHKVVPLYTTIPLVPGCDRIYAYVRAEHQGGPTGAIQGQADNLTDETGSAGPGVPQHNSAMTHLFAVPS